MEDINVKTKLSEYESYQIQQNLRYFKPTKISKTLSFAEEIRNSLLQ